MLVIDVVAIVALLAALAVGIARGFLASIGTILGLIAGALAAYWLVPLAGPWIPDAAWRPFLLIGGSVVLVLLGAAAGTAVGEALRAGVDRMKLKPVDRTLGGILSTVAMALVLLMGAATVTATGAPGIAPAVASSRVLGILDVLTPAPVDTALAQLRGAFVDEGLPRLGELLRAEVAPTAPPVTLDDPALTEAAASVARISGTAAACGTALTGSGYVAAPDLVVTNAHVVAGVDTPFVELPGRASLQGRIVYFDPVDDLAVVSVAGLGAAPLDVVDPVAAGSAVVVQGYPLGGPFTSTSAHVLSVGVVPVPGINGAAASPREIYALQADVQPGNSGGPLLTATGDVAGVVFARGDDGQSRGYAMTTTELRPALAASASDGPTVASGACAR